jgi:hypothetical protein
LNDTNKDTPVEIASGLSLKLEREIVKEALKEGIRDWIDDKYREVGKYTLAALAAVTFAGLIYFVLMLSGWHSPVVK